MIRVGREMTSNPFIQNVSLLGPFALRICPRVARKKFSLQLSCPKPSMLHILCDSSLHCVAKLIRKEVPPWCISSLRYLCTNSFSKCSLHKLISHMEQLIHQASISCQDAHGFSSQTLRSGYV